MRILNLALDLSNTWRRNYSLPLAYAEYLPTDLYDRFMRMSGRALALAGYER